SILDGWGPRQALLLKKYEPIKATHRKTIPFKPSKLTAAQLEINQSVIFDKAIERDVIQGTRPTPRRAPFVNILDNIEIPTNTHPHPPQRLNPRRKRIPQLLLRPEVIGCVNICHNKILSILKEPAMTPKNMLATLGRLQLYLCRIPDS
ncbi:hypothetical protein L195_g044745, partial [Trifolium pratense]